MNEVSGAFSRVDSFSDNNIMHLVRQDQVQHLSLLFERYHKRIYNYFLRLMRDPGLSDDLTQEVFLRVLKYRKSYRPKVPFAKWIFTIARDVGLDHLRKQDAESDLSEHTIEAHAGDPDAHLSHSQDLARLERALGRLSFEKREALILSRFHQMKYQQIAAITDSTVAAVKVRIHRAMNDLRGMLANKVEESP
jgi:RNA polymerase sigma-70 factor (ECF subfamily)